MPVDKQAPNPATGPPPTSYGNGLGWVVLLFLVINFLILPLVVKSQVTAVPYSDFIQMAQAGKVARVLISPDEIRFSLVADLIHKTPAESPKPSPGSSPAAVPAPTAGVKAGPAAVPAPTAGVKAGPAAGPAPTAGVKVGPAPGIDYPEPSLDNYSKIYTSLPVPGDADLTKILRDSHVVFSAAPANWLGSVLSWVIPPIIFVAFWMWMIRRTQGGVGSALTIGKSKARIYSQGSTGVTFQDVAGVDEARAELEEIVEFLKKADKYRNLGARIPKGVLVVGAPGTGKTLLARAVAGEAGVPFFSISGSEFIEMFVGVGAARVRDLFEQAKREAPCIVFIDELDALGRQRGGSGPMMGGNDEREQTLNQLLTEMDGFQANTGVIILAATNRPEVLDPALRRPGRFDRLVVVDLPDRKGREAILQVHAAKVKLASNVDLPAVAMRTPGFAGADLANLVNEAALLAARRNAESVEQSDLYEAIERVIAGLEKKSRVLTQDEKKTVAYHEVGHAIVGAVLPGGSTVEKISIVPRGVAALGYTLQVPEDERFLMKQDEIRGKIAALMGGRAAEEIIFGNVSTGAADDIQKATDFAERCVTMYGMSERLGPIAFEKVQQHFLTGIENPKRSVSPKVAEEIDFEIRRIVDGAHQAALRILRANRPLLEEIADDLFHYEVLEGSGLRERLDRAVVPPDLEPWIGQGKPLMDLPPNGRPTQPSPSTRPL